MIRPILLLFGIVLMGFQSYGQRTITGTVTSSDAEPLIGVNIRIQGTTRGTVTDFDGAYTLEASEGDVLEFSYTGFQSTQFTVGASDQIDVVMSEGAQLDEVVVVGYGTQKKVTVTGAVAQLEGGDITMSPAVDMSNSLAGRLPGLVVIQNSGEPGYDGATVNIRGTNTLGDNSPLIVIDGIPDRDGGLGRLTPQDIESISVLKDASAAIYGARAANGVILITTKRGTDGTPTVSYDFNYGWAQPTRVPEMSSAVEYANIINEINLYQSIPVDEWEAAWDGLQTEGVYDSPTDGVGTISANYSPEAIELHGNGTDPWGYPDEDWFDAALSTWAPQQRHNLQISGGSDKFRYLTSIGYVNQEAFYKNTATFYKQYNLRINLDANINEYIKASVGLVGRREDRNFPTQGAGAIFRMLMRGRPTEPAIWPNGMPGPDIENGQNPVVITTNATGYDHDPTDYLQAQGAVEFTNPWVEGLKLSLSGSVDHNNRKRKIWQTPWMLYSWDRVSYDDNGDPLLEGAIRSNFTDPRLREFTSDVLNTTMTALLEYDIALGADHSINALAGVTRETFMGSDFEAYRRNYISPAIDQLFAGGSLQQETDGSAYERARLGYYGRVRYNFREKYMAEFIWRFDGSYIFPEDDRFGFFPGLLLGWNITQEDWFNVGAFDYLKLRASYGQMGNDYVAFDVDGNGTLDLQEYAFLSTYSFGAYPINQVVETTLQETILANPSFTWERANNYNIGIDGTIGGNFDFTLEYFYNRRDQILIQKTGSTPQSSGINSLLPPVNAGQVDNQGFEFNFVYNGGQGGLRYSAGINGGYAKNEVVFMDEVPGAPDYQLQEGKPIGAFLVYESDGAFLDQAEIEANTIDYSAITGQLLPGDMKFKDVNGDGVIDGDDQVRIDRNNVPNFNFGATFNLQWSGFDFSMLWQGAMGARIRLYTESGDIGNFLKYDHDNRWSIDNPSSEHPRLASRGDTYYTGGNFGNNTYWLYNKDYIRLKNIELGYSFNRSLISWFKNIRVYVNALNLLTISNRDIIDPEVSSGSGQYYPQSRVINTGLSVTF